MSHCCTVLALSWEHAALLARLSDNQKGLLLWPENAVWVLMLDCGSVSFDMDLDARGGIVAVSANAD